eukprot:m.133838 g.133838  ORF g.133838 m.133838 type:complete len:330 (-) comp29698_c0_seq1:627-1616(-)
MKVARGSKSLWAISDLHSDFAENMVWIKSMKQDAQKYKAGFLIVSGDVSDDIKLVAETLSQLQSIFTGGVAFVPGNHDLWLNKEERASQCTSITKFERLNTMCKHLLVHTGPVKVCQTDSGEGGVVLLPLQSWHHSSWDTEPDITSVDLPPVERMCNDYNRCKRPGTLDPKTDDVAKYFDALNTNALASFDQPNNALPVVSFSHFLPHQELLPEKRMLYYPHLSKMVGSIPLKNRLRHLKPNVHVFGHTHFAWDDNIEGVRYIQAPLAYPHERNRGVSTPKDWNPFLIYNQESGFSKYPQSCRWPEHYRTTKRNPQELELAPWVKERWM